jgi:hypothetical protein
MMTTDVLLRNVAYDIPEALEIWDVMPFAPPSQPHPDPATIDLKLSQLRQQQATLALVLIGCRTHTGGVATRVVVVRMNDPISFATVVASQT